MAGRRPARDSTTLGSPQGIHRPGILPEPAVVEMVDGEPTREQRLVLEDLAEALPPEERDAAVAEEESAEPVELPRERLQFRSWGIVLWLAFSAISLLGSAVSWFWTGHLLFGAALAAVGLLSAAGAVRAFAGRGRSRA